MELVTFRLPFGRPFVLRPLGDLQFTGKGGTMALDNLKRDIDETLEQGGFFIGMGDYIDFMSPSNRQRLKASALYETAEDVIDQKSLDLIQELFDLALRSTVGRWIGLLEGHHFTELRAGDTTDMRLCELLKARHLGSEAVIRLQFRQSKGANCYRSNIVIHAHHGVGSGSFHGASLNKLENAAKAWGGIDIFLRGHDTKMPAAPINRIYPRWHGKGAPDLTHRKIYLVNTGSYSKSRIVGSRVGQIPRGGYAERGAMNANVLGSPLIIVQHSRSTRDIRTGSRKHLRKQETLGATTIRVQI